MKQYLEDNFNKCAVDIKKKCVESLTNRLEKIKVFDSWEILVNEFEDLFNDIIANQRKLCINEKKAENIVNMNSLSVLSFIFILLLI